MNRYGGYSKGIRIQPGEAPRNRAGHDAGRRRPQALRRRKAKGVGIARALLREPRLLIFDEATSALDSLTEEAITETIREIAAQRQQITIMIAHRLSTIMYADNIIVLEKGKITEQGSHDELLEQKGLYYAMWRQQIGERRPKRSFER